MSKLSALIVLALLSGCGGAKHPLETGDGGSTGGSTGSAGGGGGTTGTGGNFVPGSGGSSGGSGGSGTNTGGTQGGGGVGGNLGGFLDGGLGGILDGGLGGLIEAGVIGTCPPNANGQACGAGGPLACVSAAEGGAPSGCLCFAQKWMCGGQGGLPGAGDGGQGMGVTPTPCPAGAAGMSCPMAGALCTTMGGGCACVPGQAGNAWRCL